MKTANKKPKGKLTFIKGTGRNMNLQRYWKDSKGSTWRDPHPNIDLIPGKTLILVPDKN